MVSEAPLVGAVVVLQHRPRDSSHPRPQALLSLHVDCKVLAREAKMFSITAVAVRAYQVQ